MEGIQGILDDWAACQPEDIVLRASKIGQVISRVAARADALADADAKGRVYDFLAARADGPPLLVQRLRIDGGHRFDGTEELVAVVHFLCFWRTLQEICIASRSRNALDHPREAIAEELGRFRNGLLDGHAAGTLTVGSLIEALVETRRQSVDQSAWAPLQATVAKTATVAAETRERNGLSRDVHDEHLPLDAVSMLVLPWLKDLTKDYLRGEKARRITVVSKSLGCEASDACSYLCKHRWNVEITLRKHRAAKSLATQRAQVKKLTQDALAEVAHASQTAVTQAENEARRSSDMNSQTRRETKNEAGGNAVGVRTIVHLGEPPIASNDESTIAVSEEATICSTDEPEQASIDSPGTVGMSSPTLQPLAPSLMHPVGNSIFRSVPTMTPVGDIADVSPMDDSEDPLQRRLSTESQESQDPLELLKILSANAEDVEEVNEDEDGDEEECQICVQPYSKRNERLMTKCCDQAICAHCAATLATADGQLRCPFCRRIDQHPAVIARGPQPSNFDVFQGANNVARDVGRFFKDLFGTPSEQGAPSRPNLRLDVVYR